MNIELKINHYSIKLYYEGLVWFYARRCEFVGYSSWSDGNNHCSIEIILKTNSFVIEMDTKEKWIEVLKVLDEGLR